MKARDLKTHPPKILVYGPHGSGKTGLIAQASGGYLIDSDAGMRTALNLQDKFTKYRQEIEFDEFLEDPRSPKAWIKIKEKIFSIGRELRAGKWQYDALGIDSLTRLGTYCTNQVMMQAGKPMEPPQLQHYNTIVTEMRNILQLITSFPCLVLVATHEVPIETANGTMIKPKSVGQKLADEVCCMFDEIWMSRVQKKPAAQGHADYLVSWLPSNIKESRTRSGKLQELSIMDIGLRGVLKEVGYNYVHEPVAKSQ